MTIAKTFDTEVDKKKFPRTYIIIIAVVLFTLTLIEIWASNTVIAHGERYEKLSYLEKNLIMENLILENEIAKNSSLNLVASKSAELGFLNPVSIQYIR